MGRYRLVGRLGAGGMGQVFLGETPGGRKVAVKLIHPRHAHDAQFRVRFAREIEAARRVGGFHTALVVDADADADPPWMVTAYIDGPSLEDTVIASGPLRPDRVRALGAALAEGLAAIHACGLVHRDLKPGNVIMAGDGPRIIDFGIARTDDATRLTTAGAVIGTAGYISPEQLGGDPGGPASDVFSLGGVLAFAATGRAPFGSDSAPAIISRIIGQPPDLAGLADEPIRQLIAGCLAKSPADRPALPVILAALTTPGIPPAGHRTRQRPRQPTTLVASPGGIQASQLLILAEGKHGASPVGGVAFSPDGRLLASGHADGTIRLWDPASGKHRVSLAGHENTVSAVAFSPDGRLLASGGQDTTVRLWDPATGKRRRTLGGHENTVSAVVFSRDGRLLASGSWDSTVRLWDPATGEHRRTLSGHASAVSAVAFSPDGWRVAAGGEDMTVRLWNAVSGLHRHTLSGHTGPVRGVAFSPDGRLLASGGTDGTVRLWEPVRGEHRRTLSGHASAVSAVAFSPDGRLLASSGEDMTVRLWDPAGGEHRLTLTASSGIKAVAFGPDGRLLAGGGGDGTVRLWLLTLPG